MFEIATIKKITDKDYGLVVTCLLPGNIKINAFLLQLSAFERRPKINDKVYLIGSEDNKFNWSNENHYIAIYYNQKNNNLKELEIRIGISNDNYDLYNNSKRKIIINNINLLKTIQEMLEKHINILENEIIIYNSYININTKNIEIFNILAGATIPPATNQIAPMIAEITINISNIQAKIIEIQTKINELKVINENLKTIYFD